MHYKFLLILGCSFLSLFFGCAVNPVSGDKELMLLSPEQDIEIGRKYAPEIEKYMGGPIADEALQHYIDSVGQRLVQVSHAAAIKFHFTALDHKSINAFALPGGYIFITKGLLEKIQTEAQLASIFGHEITHVAARHSAAAISREIGMSVLLMGMVIASPSQGTAAAGQVTEALLSLRYTRDDEREADRSGLLYMVRAGYDPRSAAQVMQVLNEQEIDNPPELWSSHPLTEDRINYLNRRVAILTEKYDLSALRIGRQEYQGSVLDRLKNLGKSVK